MLNKTNKKRWKKADNKLEKTREELLTFIYMKLNISEREKNILVSKIRNHKYAYGNWLKYLYP